MEGCRRDLKLSGIRTPAKAYPEPPTAIHSYSQQSRIASLKGNGLNRGVFRKNNKQSQMKVLAINLEQTDLKILALHLDDTLDEWRLAAFEKVLEENNRKFSFKMVNDLLVIENPPHDPTFIDFLNRVLTEAVEIVAAQDKQAEESKADSLKMYSSLYGLPVYSDDPSIVPNFAF